MGAAVVSRVGQTHVSRVGLSVLTSVGHADLTGESDDAFVRTAVALASNPPRLTDLRRALREQVRSSPLCQASGFSRRFELALRDAWRGYCAT